MEDDAREPLSISLSFSLSLPLSLSASPCLWMKEARAASAIAQSVLRCFRETTVPGAILALSPSPPRVASLLSFERCSAAASLYDADRCACEAGEGLERGGAVRPASASGAMGGVGVG